MCDPREVGGITALVLCAYVVRREIITYRYLRAAPIQRGSTRKLFQRRSLVTPLSEAPLRGWYAEQRQRRAAQCDRFVARKTGR